MLYFKPTTTNVFLGILAKTEGEIAFFFSAYQSEKAQFLYISSSWPTFISFRSLFEDVYATIYLRTQPGLAAIQLKMATIKKLQNFQIALAKQNSGAASVRLIIAARLKTNIWRSANQKNTKEAF